MKNRIISIVIVCPVVIVGFLGFITFESEVVSASTFYVGGTGPGNFTSINAAILVASPGDTIFVYDDSAPYNEVVIIDKTISLIGENRDTTIIDGGGIGDVVRITADWVNITSFNITNSGGTIGDAGIELNNIQNCMVVNNRASSHIWAGIYLDSSSRSNITDNIALDNAYGLYLYSSNGNNITCNTASSNYLDSIYLDSSRGNNIAGNTVSTHLRHGIHLFSSTGNTVTDNNASNNVNGIYLESSVGTNITGNTMIENGISIYGEFDKPEHWGTHNIDTSNTVNGKPVYYWKNKTDGTVPPNAGQVILINCTNVRIENQELTNCSIGIKLYFSSNNSITINDISNNTRGICLYYSCGNRIESNNASNNDPYGIYLYYSDGNNITGNTALSNSFGIWLVSSSNNTIFNNSASSNDGCGINLYGSSGNNITGNTVSNNWGGIKVENSSNNIIANNIASSSSNYGIWLEEDSSNNRVYHNNIIDNLNQAYDDTNNGNQWNDGYPSGGNYWSDYTGVDEKSGPNQDQPISDGIGDTPYVIDLNSQDDYPLINVSVVTDCDPPIIQLISPSNNSVIKPGTVIDLSVLDPHLDDVVYSLNGNPDQTLAPPFDIDTADWDDGNYTVKILAIDTYDNTNTTWFKFSIDSILPKITLNSPQNNSMIKIDTEIDLTISDVNLNQVTYSKNSGVANPLFPPYNINTNDWPDREYIITVYADDLAGNFDEKWFVFTKDSTLPEITLNSPENNSLLLQASTLDFDVSDENLNSVIYSANQGTFVSFEAPYDLDTMDWEDGDYVITIIADDFTGNTNEKWFIFWIDTSSPSVVSISPDDKATDIAIEVEIIIEFSEPMDAESVESAISIMPYIEYSCSWNNDNKTLTLKLSDPLAYETLYQISISTEAKDIADQGLENKYEFEFTTKEKPKEDEEGFPITYLILILLLAIIAAVITVGIVSSKKKKPS